MKKKYDIKTTDVETLKKWYHLMTLGRALDEKAPSYLLQSLLVLSCPYAGHDGIQLAIGQVFTLGEDFLFPYYRDMLTVLSAGMTPEEIILNGISKATDPQRRTSHVEPFRQTGMAHRKHLFCNGYTRPSCGRCGTGNGILWT